eukprot:2091137-Prymnesium_polylepis.1
MLKVAPVPSYIALYVRRCGVAACSAMCGVWALQLRGCRSLAGDCYRDWRQRGHRDTWSGHVFTRLPLHVFTDYPT